MVVFVGTPLRDALVACMPSFFSSSTVPEEPSTVLLMLCAAFSAAIPAMAMIILGLLLWRRRPSETTLLGLVTSKSRFLHMSKKAKQTADAAKAAASRYLAILATFANRGATLGDIKAAMCNSMCSRRATAMNDVGWRVLEGNFGSGGITQVSPNTTSIGHWQVGSTADAYGRYARGFERASGKTEMAFVLERRMFGGLPIVTPLRLEVRVVYYDMFGGGFNVSYDAGTAGCRQVQVAVGASGGWKSVTIPLLASQGYFGRKCGRDGGADITLTSTSNADSIVSSLEIYKVDPTPGVGKTPVSTLPSVPTRTIPAPPVMGTPSPVMGTPSSCNFKEFFNTHLWVCVLLFVFLG